MRDFFDSSALLVLTQTTIVISFLSLTILHQLEFKDRTS